MQLLVNIVVLTAIYALIGCGYVLIYRTSRVLNLAHGELMMLAAYLLLTTASLFSGHPLAAVIASALLGLVAGALVYLSLMRRMTGERVLAVASVDGINVITGETATPAQSGYVLDPFGSVDIAGWRKSMGEVAAFVFTPLPDSSPRRACDSPATACLVAE